MRVVYCANCGQKLPIFRKALPQYARIVDLVESHVCTEEPQEIDLAPIENVPVIDPGTNKFVQKLDKLPKNTGPGDLRKPSSVREELTNTAPTSILGQVQTEDPLTGDPRLDPRKTGELGSTDGSEDD